MYNVMIIDNSVKAEPVMVFIIWRNVLASPPNWTSIALCRAMTDIAAPIKLTALDADRIGLPIFRYFEILTTAIIAE